MVGLVDVRKTHHLGWTNAAGVTIYATQYGVVHRDGTPVTRQHIEQTPENYAHLPDKYRLPILQGAQSPHYVVQENPEIDLSDKTPDEQLTASLEALPQPEAVDFHEFRQRGIVSKVRVSKRIS